MMEASSHHPPSLWYPSPPPVSSHLAPGFWRGHSPGVLVWSGSILRLSLARVEESRSLYSPETAQVQGTGAGPTLPEAGSGAGGDRVPQPWTADGPDCKQEAQEGGVLQPHSLRKALPTSSTCRSCCFCIWPRQHRGRGFWFPDLGGQVPHTFPGASLGEDSP